MLKDRSIRAWLVLAGAAVVLQQAITTYPASQNGARAFWAVLSLALLWFVYRRSNLARIVFLAAATVGLVIFALAAISDVSSNALPLAVLYCLQAISMLVKPVKAWTQAAPSPALSASSRRVRLPARAGRSAG